MILFCTSEASLLRGHSLIGFGHLFFHTQKLEDASEHGWSRIIFDDTEDDGG